MRQMIHGYLDHLDASVIDPCDTAIVYMNMGEDFASEHFKKN